MRRIHGGPLTVESQARHLETERAERPPLRPFTPSSGAVKGLISAFDTLLKPIQYLLLNPSHPALAELHPLGERPGRFKARNMLRGIEYELLELTLRQYPHRGISFWRSIALPHGLMPTVDGRA